MSNASRQRQPKRSRREAGNALIEFALVSLVLYLLVGATVELGRVILAQRVLQDAAQVTARELALVPLPATADFDAALADPFVQANLVDNSNWVIDLDAFADDAALDTFYNGLPLLNRLLRPLMIVDFVTIDGAERRLLRYPGAIVQDGTDLTVLIPRVTGRDAQGVETIDWLPIVEEVRVDPADPTTGPFAINSLSGQQGLVALRINYPFQSAALSGFRPNPVSRVEPNLDLRNRADDASVVADALPSGTLLGDDGRPGPYAGSYGLGRQFAFAEEIRPYRRLLTAQAVFRREVFR